MAHQYKGLKMKEVTMLSLSLLSLIEFSNRKRYFLNNISITSLSITLYNLQVEKVPGNKDSDDEDDDDEEAKEEESEEEVEEPEEVKEIITKEQAAAGNYIYSFIAMLVD